MMKTILSLASVATLALAAGSFTPVAANPTPRTVSQAGAPAMKPLSLEEKDARMAECTHYRNAFHRLDDVKRQIAQLQNDFAATDDIRPKLDELVTQTNDAQQTAKIRVASCPGQRR